MGGSKDLVTLLSVLFISLDDSVRTYHSSPEVKYVTETGIQHLSGVAADWITYLQEILAQTFSSCDNILDRLVNIRC